MKRAFIKYLLLGLILLPIAAFGQGTVYQNHASGGFSAKDHENSAQRNTGGGCSSQRRTCRDGASPYEFCDEAEYKETVHQTYTIFSILHPTPTLLHASYQRRPEQRESSYYIHGCRKYTCLFGR